MSTQHVNALQPGEGRLNALLTDKGRLVDLVLHLDRGERGVLLVGHPHKDLAGWLDRYLFTEKVTLEPQTGPALDVWGPDAAQAVDAIVPGAAQLQRWGFVEHGEVIVARAFDRVVDGALTPAFVVVGSAMAPNTDDEAFERARVASGVPGKGEIVEAYTPLDLGMHDAIHWAKGCYIGQEVIARLDTYQKQHRRLVVVHADGPIAVGAAVQKDGAQVGAVTSAVGNTGLAIVKLADDGAVEVGGVKAKAETPATAQKTHD